MILFLSDYYYLFMLQGKAEDIISQGVKSTIKEQGSQKIFFWGQSQGMDAVGEVSYFVYAQYGHNLSNTVSL